jgi:2-polyprenyl-3-methyl-5-hydroxy-6-metoxy-1,4-benzoquinol methylase
MNSRLNIGITICLQDENESVWINGIKQNAIFLARTFMNSTKNYNVYIVNTSNVKITNNLGWDINYYKTVQFNDIKDKLDIIFPLGGSLDRETVKYLRQRGCKVVPYKCGNEYVISMENIIFGRADNKPDYPEVDQVWHIPQMKNTNEHYWRVLHNTESITIPFVWNSMFLDSHIEELKRQGKPTRYQPSKKSKRISIFEPNINVYKFAMYPILIIEDLYRQRPELLQTVKVTNTQKIRLYKEFIFLMTQLDLQKDGKITFENRFPMAWFLSEHTDIVLAHQWENALNYAYLDAIYMGYPLVHNAHLCKDCGYYYNEFDIDEGREQLLYAMTEHDNHLEEYEEKSKKVLERFSSDNMKVVKKYDVLIENLMNKGKYLSDFKPTSFGIFKSQIRDYVLDNFDINNISILDVGCGCGTYANVFPEVKNIDGVEAYEYYVGRYDLKDKYRNVYVMDIMNFDFEYYDIIILGDVLEHLTVENGQLLIDRIYNKCRQIIVSVPYQMSQFGLENTYETHIQSDLTEDIMRERYPKLKKVWGSNVIGVYMKNNG